MMKPIYLFLVASLLAGCSSPKSASKSESLPNDAVYQRVSSSAHAAFGRGDIERAASLFEQAYVRAQVMDRHVAVADSAYHLAVCRIALGDVDAGLPLLAEAESEWSASGMSVMPALLARAEALRLAGDPEAAWRVTDAALAQAREREERGYVYVLRALLALESGDLETAGTELRVAANVISRSSSPRLQARLAEVEGKLAWSNQAFLPAAHAFDREAKAYAREGRYGDRARALLRAAAAYADAGDVMSALERYHRAARHFAAAGDTLRALETIKIALPLMDEEAAANWAERMARLVEQIDASVKKSIE